jgi:hypothetical protein
MFHDDYDAAPFEPVHDAGQPPFECGRRGPWGGGPRMHGRHGHRGFGHEHGPHGRGDFEPEPGPEWRGGFGPGRGPWGRRGWRAPFGQGGPHFGPPWTRGGFDPERFAAFQTLRPSIASLMALLRAADARQLRQIQGVLDDTRRRIAAILAEDQPARPSEPAQTSF